MGTQRAGLGINAMRFAHAQTPHLGFNAANPPRRGINARNEPQ